MRMAFAPTGATARTSTLTSQKIRALSATFNSASLVSRHDSADASHRPRNSSGIIACAAPVAFQTGSGAALSPAEGAGASGDAGAVSLSPHPASPSTHTAARSLIAFSPLGHDRRRVDHSLQPSAPAALPQ